MREIIVFENVTLDGFMAGPHGEIDWAVPDDEPARISQEGGGSVDTFMFGRITYEMMAAFWPTPAGKAANPTFAASLNNAPKVVFSRTLTSAGWQGAQLTADLTRDSVRALKSQPGQSIMIFGSASIVQQLSALDLVDEYQLVVNPVVLGSGLRLFKDAAGPVQLRLSEGRALKSGVVFLRYRPRPR